MLSFSGNLLSQNIPVLADPIREEGEYDGGVAVVSKDRDTERKHEIEAQINKPRSNILQVLWRSLLTLQRTVSWLLFSPLFFFSLSQ